MKSVYWRIFALIIVTLFGFCVFARSNFLDFSAFSCAGEAVRLHQNPYLAGSLHSCEGRIAGQAITGFPTSFAIPAPFPAYSLAFYSLFSYLGAGPDKALWLLLSVLSIAFVVVSLRNITKLSITLIAGVLGMGMIFITLVIGQMTPLLFAAMLLMIHFVKNNSPYLAACACIVTMLEPHIGVAACVGLAIVEFRSIWMLLGGMPFYASFR